MTAVITISGRRAVWSEGFSVDMGNDAFTTLA